MYIPENYMKWPKLNRNLMFDSHQFKGEEHWANTKNEFWTEIA